jgi:hypothetical protein
MLEKETQTPLSNDTVQCQPAPTAENVKYQK